MTDSRAGGCWHPRSPIVASRPHDRFPETDVVTRRCEDCGAERDLTSPRYRGRGYAGDGSDPDRGADRHLSGGRR